MLRSSPVGADIPAFVDETFDSYDQVIENEQREGLKPLEIALFIKRQLDRGQSRIDIARGIGKSPSYVTVASALVDAPDWLMDAYRAGKCRGMFELCELRRLHEKDAAAVQAWLGRRRPRRPGGPSAVEGPGERACALRPRDDRSRRHGGKPRGQRFTRCAISSGPAQGWSILGRRPVMRRARPLPPAFEPFKSDDDSAMPLSRSLPESLCVEAQHDGRKVRVVLDELPITPATVYVVAEDGARVVASVRTLGRLELFRATKPRP